MRYPVNLILVTNGYTSSHKGIDLGWNETVGKNQPVYACDDGIVISVENQTKGGHVIYIKHLSGMVSAYGHLFTSSIKVKKNQKVYKGQQIANMGSSGIVTGAHLHFGLYKANSNYYQSTNALNPLNYLYYSTDQKVDPQSKYKDSIKKEQLVSNYQKGIYTCLANMKIRSGPGINFKEIKVTQTTSLAKSALVSKKSNDIAIFKKGTNFTAENIVQTNNEIWAKTPNGYICIKDNNNIYCEKIG